MLDILCDGFVESHSLKPAREANEFRKARDIRLYLVFTKS